MVATSMDIFLLGTDNISMRIWEVASPHRGLSLVPRVWAENTRPRRVRATQIAYSMSDGNILPCARGFWCALRNVFGVVDRIDRSLFWNPMNRGQQIIDNIFKLLLAFDHGTHTFQVVGLD